MKHFRNQIAGVIFFIFILTNLSLSQTVIKHPQTKDKLEARWQWALKQAKDQKLSDGFWIGYSIQRMMGKNSFIGTFKSHPKSDETPLEELIYNKKTESSEPKMSDEETIQKAAKDALQRIQDPESGEIKMMKEVAILFEFSGKPDPNNIDQVKVSNLSLHVEFDDLPLIWLGKAEDDQSIPLLEKIYQDASSENTKEKMVMAVGIHEQSDLAVSFLESVLKSSDPDDVREKAAFWMGQQGTERALKILLATAQKDRSSEVREKAVFGISQIKIEGAAEALIDLAEHAKDEDIREKAIFWLGQREGEKALKFLVKAAKSDPSSEVREKAVFAISQMKSDEAVNELIDLAYHAKEWQVRKKAIFWLGQKASKRAVEALEDVAANDSDVEIQKQAVFALTQLPDDQGVPNLIKIAKTHPSREVRKKAIFWLGQSDDPRALDALVEIVGK
jgi:HEAT repeat protein